VSNTNDAHRPLRVYEFRCFRSCSRLAARARNGLPSWGVGSATKPHVARPSGLLAYSIASTQPGDLRIWRGIADILLPLGLNERGDDLVDRVRRLPALTRRSPGDPAKAASSQFRAKLQ